MQFKETDLEITIRTLLQIEKVQEKRKLEKLFLNDDPLHNLLLKCMRVIKRLQFHSSIDRMFPMDDDRLRFTLHKCYCCKQRVHNFHQVYDYLCSSCGALNWDKRHDFADLSGYNALVTGARIKLGFHTALKLLRCGATVFVTSRFLDDTLTRYSSESDYAYFKDRLHIIRADFTRYSDITNISITLQNYLLSRDERLHILINNAAQTVRRPADFYASIIDKETLPIILPPDLPPKDGALLENTTNTDSALFLFPPGKVDEDGQQIDLRRENSWSTEIHDTDILEVAEVLTINTMAPFILIKELLPLMKKKDSPLHSDSKVQHPHAHAHAHAYIVNVSSTEGVFTSQTRKSHVHTNMAKAALNMLTETIHSSFRKYDIFVNSVDPGFVSDMSPKCETDRKSQLPLDMWDGASRILDPIYMGTRGCTDSGFFFKCYSKYDWSNKKSKPDK